MKTDLLKVSLLFLVFAIFTGCNNSFEGFTKSDTTMSFTTINVRLGDELSFFNERNAVIEQVLAEADSDVICIQELYDSKKMNSVKKYLTEDLGYRYSLWLTTKNEDFEPIPPSCTQEDVAPILACYMENCMNSTDQTCIVTNCWSVFLTMPQACQTCLLGQGISAIAGGDIQAVLQGCMSETEVSYNHDGNNGILLASKYPMKDKGSLGLTSTGNYRMAIYATVDNVRAMQDPEHPDETIPVVVNSVQVICTGLSKLSDTEYTGLAGSWAQEQMTQTSEILSIPFKDDVSQRVILGDFDGNLAGGYNIKESNATPVSAIISAGYYDPYFDISENDELACTVCADNPMAESGIDSVPDHIFFFNKRGYIFETKRTFINEFIKFSNNKKESYSLSDHYGLTVKMTVDPNF
ncbi:MAG TPA: hypothetical protein PKG52_06880 [bacterium]|nr:hypothetical protein [bacterium]HPS28809.1 hypothetical protein [bacterium]